MLIHEPLVGPAASATGVAGRPIKKAGTLYHQGTDLRGDQAIE